jgi:hypothetical protein
VPVVYHFADADGANATSYAGQTFRQLTIVGMKSYIGGLTEQIDSGELVPAEGSITGSLNFYFDIDADAAIDLMQPISTDPATEQSYYTDFPSIKSLKGKIAGNDATGQHKDWSTDFMGWSSDQASSPEELVLYWFAQIEDAAIERANGVVPNDPSGEPVSNAFVTAEGQDHQQLLQKFLMGAVSFSQGADDYLDDDTDGKGLNSSNAIIEGKNYSELAHAWDEGFGYFGAAIDYKDYTDEEISGKGGRPEYEHGYHDFDGNGSIDLLGELNMGHSVNCGKRDRGSSGNANPTDFTTDAINAFLTGRAIIANAGDVLTGEEMNALQEQRDIAVLTWEKCIASTAVHYINDVLGDMKQFGTDDYNFLSHAKDWSELKGFALSLQFNPRSPLNDADFATLHAKIGDAPVLPTAEDGAAADYEAALLEARSILQIAYDFDGDNVLGW